MNLDSKTIAAINDALKRLPSDEARVEILRRLAAGICPRCGAVTDRQCPCEKDE